MYKKLSRRGAVGAGAAALASVAVPRFRGEAAEFEYKFSHAFPTSHPFHIRITEMWAAVRDETGGRLNVTTFPNSELGGDDAVLGQLRSGAIQFVCEIGATLGSVVPASGIEGVGFAFKSSAEGLAAMDGPLGDYVRRQIEAKGLYAFPTVFDVGMRQVTSRTKPIVTTGDFAGFKLRVPTAKIVVDLFSTLGAIPAPLAANALYTSLQTRVVDGCEFPLNSMEAFKLYEVQKYVSLTNHMWVGYWLIGNAEAVGKLPPEVRGVVVRNNQKYALIERHDTAVQEDTMRKTLEGQGMIFRSVDTAPLRAKLAPYYARWRAEFGDLAWSLLEKTSGKLA